MLLAAAMAPMMSGLSLPAPVSRRRQPHERSRRSIMIAGRHAIIQPFPGPTGWRVVVHTSLTIVDIARAAPTAFAPGDILPGSPASIPPSSKGCVGVSSQVQPHEHHPTTHDHPGRLAGPADRPRGDTTPNCAACRPGARPTDCLQPWPTPWSANTVDQVLIRATSARSRSSRATPGSPPVTGAPAMVTIGGSAACQWSTLLVPAGQPHDRIRNRSAAHLPGGRRANPGPFSRQAPHPTNGWASTRA